MKLKSALTINGKKFEAGDEVSPWAIYPFFMLHMGIFGLSGFLMCYGDPESPPLIFLYAHGGFAILIYLAFYFSIFGKEEVEWMFINAGLGLFGIYAEIKYILSWFGRNPADYSYTRQAIPFLYYILYTFLLRQALLDLTGSHDNPERKRVVEALYIVVSVLIYGAIYLHR
jgi:hypothetical protein